MKKIILSFICIFSLFSNIAYSQSGWIQQYIGSYDDGFKTLQFFNQNTGIVVSGFKGFIYKTTNAGQNWLSSFLGNNVMYFEGYYFDELNYVIVGQRYPISSGFGLVTIFTNGLRSDILFQPTTGKQLTQFVSTDWINRDTGFISGYDFGPGGATGRALKTINHGVNWIEITPSIVQAVYSIDFINYNIGYIIADGSFRKTTNSGLNWFQLAGVGNANHDLKLVTKDTFYVCGYNGEVKISSDSGNSWQSRPVGHNNLELSAIDFINSKTGWVCGDSGYIFRTTNAGINWQQQISGVQSFLYCIYIIDTNKLWIGGYSGLVLKTTTGGVTFIKNNENYISNSFKLFQNFPNPFNSTTKISYDLPKDSKVSLVIYDILGREITRLVNGEFKQAGSYIVDFNGSNLASGVYFYRIEAGNFVQVKKMVLIK
jgi:photosystem II stability/assembly factor-like uncharacterized protein